MIESVNIALDTSIPLWGIALPLAISFYTFQQIAFLVDTYRGLTKQTRLGNYTLFVCFFPQFIAGPIVHHSETIPQFENKNFPKWCWNNILTGLTIFLIGFNKKVVIADSIAIIANQVFDNALEIPPTFFEAWFGAISYSFQIYFDFSGYSDMAIGLAFMIGIKLPINFSSPYKATSIIDFWRFWHMTLSRFLREYIYIPLGGNRFGQIRRHGNIIAVMLIGGIWHGAGWNFIIWGGLHGIYIVVNHVWRFCDTKYINNQNSPNLIWFWFSRILTFIAITIAWVFFRSETLGEAIIILQGMLAVNGIGIEGFFDNSYGGKTVTNSINLICLSCLFLIVWFFPATQELISPRLTKANGSKKLIQNPLSLDLIEPTKSKVSLILNKIPAEVLLCLASGSCILGALVVNYRGKLSTEFIYFIF